MRVTKPFPHQSHSPQAPSGRGGGEWRHRSDNMHIVSTSQGLSQLLIKGQCSTHGPSLRNSWCSNDRKDKRKRGIWIIHLPDDNLFNKSFKYQLLARHGDIFHSRLTCCDAEPSPVLASGQGWRKLTFFTHRVHHSVFWNHITIIQGRTGMCWRRVLILL